MSLDIIWQDMFLPYWETSYQSEITCVDDTKSRIFVIRSKGDSQRMCMYVYVFCCKVSLNVYGYDQRRIMASFLTFFTLWKNKVAFNILSFNLEWNVMPLIGDFGGRVGIYRFLRWPSGLTRQFVRPWMRKNVGLNLGDGFFKMLPEGESSNIWYYVSSLFLST